jgi:hypothetical protein
MRRAFCQQSQSIEPQRVTSWWLFLALVATAIANLSDSSLASEVPSTATPHQERAPDNQVKNPEAIDFFERRIRPLLITYCIDCHGPESQEAGLRLDLPDRFHPIDSNASVLHVGAGGKSRLMEVLEYRSEVQMPPTAPLGEEQLEWVRQWIASGAPYPANTDPLVQPLLGIDHWAFHSPQPLRDLAIDPTGWSDDPMDAVVVQRLAAEGMSPAAQASPRDLAQRLSYDLTGLPIREDLLDAYLETSDQPDSYSRLVDALIGDPAFGEHWARLWLDVARFSDAKGYVYAREERFFVHSASYRQWVIQAFNQSMPYDLFLKRQIAADLLESDPPDHLAALGFLTLGRRFLGVTHDIIDDRIDVIGRGTMGLTVACARCHDHKYDPIPTSDYYSLYGVFANSHDRLVRLRSDRASDSVPSDPMTVEDPFETELKKRQEAYQSKLVEEKNSAEERCRNRVADYLMAQTHLQDFPEEGFDQILTADDLIPNFVRRWEMFLANPQRQKDPVFAIWKELETIPPGAGYSELASQRMAAVLESQGEQIPKRLQEAFSTPPSQWKEVVERYGEVLAKLQEEWSRQERVSKESNLPAPQQFEDAGDERLRQTLVGPGSPCRIPDEGIVTTEGFFPTSVCESLWKLQGEIDRWILQSDRSIDFTVATADRVDERTARVFRRGNPANKGESVQRHFLTALEGSPPQPFGSGSGRLRLAERIASPDNPLTARVWVNRLWTHLTGQGWVRTPSDFGVRAGTPPLLPVLDQWALRLIAQDWDLKKSVREMVLSATYRQSIESSLEAKGNSVDPANHLLWKQNRRRLSLEQWRDSWLAWSGQLVRRIGGRSEEWFPDSSGPQRRSIYARIDRQFLPTALRIFDFANPDLHIPIRSETSVPQQALFLWNHPWTASVASQLEREAIVASKNSEPPGDRSIQASTEMLKWLHRRIYQRDPSQEELQLAGKFFERVSEVPKDEWTESQKAWSYGYAPIDVAAKRLGDFQPLPHFTGTSWQGGGSYPDDKLGWLQLTAAGGHPGNDHQHAIVRRWKARQSMIIDIESIISHEVAEGDGIRAWVIHNGQRVLFEQKVHRSQAECRLKAVSVHQGDTIDFVVDIADTLNSDQHLWAPKIQRADLDASQSSEGRWDSQVDFRGPETAKLTPLAQWIQVLLMSNEAAFLR